MIDEHDVLDFIIDTMEDNPQKRMLQTISSTLLRYQTIARKARLLSLGFLDNNTYVTKKQWAEDIISLTTGMPDKEPF
jgi:hypothetical protein